MGVRLFIVNQSTSNRSLSLCFFSFSSLPNPHPCGQFLALLEQGVPVHADVCGHFVLEKLFFRREKKNK